MMKWDVPIDELIPQTIRTPEVPVNPLGKSKLVGTRPAPRLEDFGDDGAS